MCGDSAGGNLAIAIAMRAVSMNIRLPEGIQTTYGCQLVRYTPSPSRMMALMDPLLPLGIISRCLAGKYTTQERCPVYVVKMSYTKEMILLFMSLSAVATGYYIQIFGW